MEALHEDDGNTINEERQNNADRERRARIPTRADEKNEREENCGKKEHSRLRSETDQEIGINLRLLELFDATINTIGALLK